MNLTDFIAKYNGKVVRGGQCGELVRQYWIDVDLTSPPSYVNSKDYWFNPVPGYDKVATPQPGSIAIYDGHGAFPEGHSAIYVDGRVFEQNADPDGSPAHLFNRSNTYLLGYLRKQGGDMADISEDNMYSLIRGILGREPTLPEMQNQDYRKDPNLAIATFWNNGGKDRYYNPGNFVPLNEQVYVKKG